MTTPFDRGFNAAFNRLNGNVEYDNPYDQEGEENDRADFRRGYDCGIDYWTR